MRSSSGPFFADPRMLRKSFSGWECHGVEECFDDGDRCGKRRAAARRNGIFNGTDASCVPSDSNVLFYTVKTPPLPRVWAAQWRRRRRYYRVRRVDCWMRPTSDGVATFGLDFRLSVCFRPFDSPTRRTRRSVMRTPIIIWTFLLFWRFEIQNSIGRFSRQFFFFWKHKTIRFSKLKRVHRKINLKTRILKYIAIYLHNLFLFCYH